MQYRGRSRLRLVAVCAAFGLGLYVLIAFEINNPEFDSSEETARLRSMFEACQRQTNTLLDDLSLPTPGVKGKEGGLSRRRHIFQTGEGVRLRRPMPPATAHHRRITLLYWTKWFGMYAFQSPHIPDPVYCPTGIAVKVTHDRHQLSQASGIIFHVRAFDENDLPERAIDQKWIIDTQESPVNDILDGATFIEDASAMRQFDYRMSYHTASDFFHPMWTYDNYTKIVLQKPVVPFEQKKGMVLFLSGNCKSFNDRESYVSELMKYVEVHSYGKCLQNKDDETIADGWEGAVSLIEKYKFYLAFENSNCEDYVSEKLTNAFRAGVVPVVAGPRDYSSFMPNNRSVINVEDFVSPRQLGEYLQKVGDSKELYQQYLEYKNGKGFSEKFKAIWEGRGEFAVFCDIAEQLFTYKSPTKLQSGTSVLPTSRTECQERGYMRKFLP